VARTFRNIQIEGKETYVLFDTGSVRSYVREEFASQVRQKVAPFTVGSGGSSLRVNESCLVNCAIEGLDLHSALCR